MLNLLSDLMQQATGLPLQTISIGNFFYIRWDFLRWVGDSVIDGLSMPNLLGVYFIGFIDISIHGEFYVEQPELIVSYLINGEISYVYEADENILEIEAQFNFGLDIDATLIAGTPGASAGFVGFMGVSLFNLFHLPILFTSGKMKVNELHISIPIHMDMNANFILKDGKLNVVPFHFSLNRSVYYKNQLSKASIDAFLPIPIVIYIPLFFSGNVKFKSTITINGSLNIDLIAGINNISLLYYTKSPLQGRSATFRGRG